MTSRNRDEQGPAPERWGLLGTFMVASAYLALTLWLLAFVAIPAIVFGWVPTVITSGSMGPLIRAGDVVLVEEPQAPNDLAPGTVVTYRDPSRPDRLVTHRILGTTPDGRYRTQGDANTVADSAPVRPSDVVGVGRLAVPLVGLPVLWIRNDPLLFALWLTLTVLAVVAAALPPDDPEDWEAEPEHDESRPLVPAGSGIS